MFHAHAVLGSDSCCMVPNIVSCNGAASSSGRGQKLVTGLPAQVRYIYVLLIFMCFHIR